MNKRQIIENVMISDLKITKYKNIYQISVIYIDY